MEMVNDCLEMEVQRMTDAVLHLHDPRICEQNLTIPTCRVKIEKRLRKRLREALS
jgi:hypothetical protein